MKNGLSLHEEDGSGGHDEREALTHLAKSKFASNSALGAVVKSSPSTMPARNSSRDLTDNTKSVTCLTDSWECRNPARRTLAHATAAAMRTPHGWICRCDHAVAPAHLADSCFIPLAA